MLTVLVVGKAEGKKWLGNLGIDGRITLKCSIKE
jgi:hypothetical protein